MIVPTALIIPPAILAMAIFLGLYYVRNPENRVTDPYFLCASACVVVVLAQMTVIVLDFAGTVPSIVLCVAAFGLLAAGVWVQGRKLIQKT